MLKGDNLIKALQRMAEKSNSDSEQEQVSSLSKLIANNIIKSGSGSSTNHMTS